MNIRRRGAQDFVDGKRLYGKVSEVSMKDVLDLSNVVLLVVGKSSSGRVDIMLSGQEARLFNSPGWWFR